MARPRKIESPEEMDRLVDEYQQKCEDKSLPITLTGLIRHLGLSSRQSLDEYAKYDGFSDSVKSAKLLVELSYETRLATSSSPTGAIFALKNMGWSDRQQLEHTGADGGPIQLSDAEREQRINALLERARARRAGSASGGEDLGAASGSTDGGAEQ